MKIEADLPGVASVDVDLELGDADDEQFGSLFSTTSPSTGSSGSGSGGDKSDKGESRSDKIERRSDDKGERRSDDKSEKRSGGDSRVGDRSGGSGGKGSIHLDDGKH